MSRPLLAGIVLLAVLCVVNGVNLRGRIGLQTHSLDKSSAVRDSLAQSSVSQLSNSGFDDASFDAMDAALDRETQQLQDLITQDLHLSDERISASVQQRKLNEKRMAQHDARPRFVSTRTDVHKQAPPSLTDASAADPSAPAPTFASFPFPPAPAPFPSPQPMPEPIVNGNEIVAAYPQTRPIHVENNNTVVDIKEIETHDDLPPVTLPLYLSNKTVARMEPSACIFPDCRDQNVTVPRELKGPLVVPHITHINPISQDPTIGLIKPLELVRPVIELEKLPPCVGVCPPPEGPKPEPLPLAPPLYDPLKVAEMELAKAKDKLNGVGWVVTALKEPRNPTDHLIQQTIANIHKIEAKDIGPLAPGDQLQFEQHIKIEDVFMVKSGDKQHMDGKSEELLGPGNIVTPNLDYIAFPKRMAQMLDDARALEIKHERQSILALQGRSLPTDSGSLELKDALFGDINSQEQRVKDRERKRALGVKPLVAASEEAKAQKEDDAAATGELSEHGESGHEHSEGSKHAIFLELESHLDESKRIASGIMNPAAQPPSKTLSQGMKDQLEPAAGSAEDSVSASTTPSVPATVTDESTESSEGSVHYLPPLNMTALSTLRSTKTGGRNTLRSHLDKLKSLMDEKRAKEDAKALKGPQKVVVARALEKLGAAVDLLAGRVSDLDKMEGNMFNKLFGKKHDGPAGTDEARMIKEKALAVKEKKESEIAQLIRNEVRILTNQMRTELLLVKGAFYSTVRDTLNQLRKDLQDNFLRTRENDKKLLAIAMGQLPNGTARLVDVLALKPVKEKDILERSIGKKISKAFNFAQNLEKKVLGARTAQAVQQEKLDLATNAYENEPSRKDLDSAISLEASKHRNRAEVTRDSEEHMLTKQGLMAKLLSDATAKELRKQLMEDPDHSSDTLFEDDSDKHPLVKQASRIAKEREKANAQQSKADMEKINAIQEKGEEDSQLSSPKKKHKGK